MSRSNNLLRITAAVFAIFALQSCYVNRTACNGRVAATLIDSTSLTGKMKLSKPSADKIAVTPDGGVRRVIPADSLAECRIWDKKSPDDTYMIMRRRYGYFGPAQGGLTLSQPGWMVSRAVGRYLAVYAFADSFKFNKRGQIYFEGTVRYIAFKPGDEVGLLIGTSASSRSSLRYSLMALCADDRALYRRLEVGDMDPSDFKNVVEAYIAPDEAVGNFI